MENEDMAIKPLNIKAMAEHPIKVGMVSLIAMVTVAWSAGRPIVVEDLSAEFVTNAEMQGHISQQVQEVSNMNNRLDTIDNKLNTIISKDERGDAYAIIASVEGDIGRHNKVINDTAAWQQTSKQLNDRLKTAILFRDCVMLERRNCEDIKDQIWQ